MRKKRKRAESGFTAAQCDAALELMEKQRSEELEGADFQPSMVGRRAGKSSPKAVSRTWRAYWSNCVA